MSQRNKVFAIITALAEDPSLAIDENTSIPGLGIDSLRLMEMVLKIEETCAVEFSDSDLLPSNLSTVGRVLATVERLRS